MTYIAALPVQVLFIAALLAMLFLLFVGLYLAVARGRRQFVEECQRPRDYQLALAPGGLLKVTRECSSADYLLVSRQRRRCPCRRGNLYRLAE